MPRARAPPTSYAESPVKSVQISLNDDASEKAQRIQSRKALQSKQLDQLRAAASPQLSRKRRSLGGQRAIDGDDAPDDHGPSTPSQDPGYDVAGTAVTPMKRVPLLANFEEWMKMATDNKINAANSWNFALIDYFHDMSLLKEEGGGVNFQKASCTLDGCVKIYTSRVDSVATETGRLLSGLADNVSRKRKGGADGEEDGEVGHADEEGEEGDDGEKKKKTRKKRSAEATLVSSFEQLKLKKMELDFAVDPLFKKASADFDEGGAKGLLLNHLSIDNTGRIVFDSSDDTQDTNGEDSRRDSLDPEGPPDVEDVKPEEAQEATDTPIDISALAARFFPDLDRLEYQDICPSLKTFELGSGTSTDTLDLPFLKAPENWRDDVPAPAKQSADEEQPTPADTYDDDEDVDAGGAFDAGLEMGTEAAGFGEGGEAWAKDAALHTQYQRVHTASEDEGGEIGTFDNAAASYGVKLQPSHGNEEENILNYFDTALAKNWAGPEHWKITRIKDATRATPPVKAKKEKEAFEIDFVSPLSDELNAMLYTKSTSNTTISLPRKEWRSRTRNLLPDDKHFDSKSLLTLFLKPRARLGARKLGASRAHAPTGDVGDVEEAYWAQHPHVDDPVHPMDEPLPQGDYNADFFHDGPLPLPGGDADDDGMSFADAREHFLPEMDAKAGAAQGIDGLMAGSSQAPQGAERAMHSRRSRPEYVQYARVAKKVDVRRLKEEMWRGTAWYQRPVERDSSIVSRVLRRLLQKHH